MQYIFSDCRQQVSAGINTWMSTCDGLGPSIFSQKMKKASPMKEKTAGKVVFFSRQSRHSDFDVVIYKIVFPICTLTQRVNNYVSRQGNGKKKKNESTKDNEIVIICGTDYITQYFYFPIL